MSYADIRAQLSEELIRYWDNAQEHKWQFIHEPHDALAFDEVRDWPELDRLLARSAVNGQSQWELVEQCMDAAMEEKLWPEAMAAALVLDRYVYKNFRERKAKDLMDKTDRIAVEGSLTIPLQIEIRRGRLLRDDGLLLEAVKHLDDLMAKADTAEVSELDGKAIKPRCLHIKSKISEILGLWQEAASDLVKAVEVLATYPRRDPKNTAYCFQGLGAILRSISEVEYGQLRQIISFEREDPYLQAYDFNRHAAMLTCYDTFQFSRHEHHAGTAILLHCLARSNPLSDEEKIDCLEKAIAELKLSLRAQVFKKIRITNDQTHDFACCLHSLGIAYRELGKGDLSFQINELSKRIYSVFQESGSMESVLDDIDVVLRLISLEPIRRDAFCTKEYLVSHIRDWEEREQLTYPSLISNTVPSTPVPTLLENLDMQVPDHIHHSDNERAKHHTQPILSEKVECYGAAASLSKSIPSLSISENEKANRTTRPVDDEDPVLATASVSERQHLMSLPSNPALLVTHGISSKFYRPVVNASVGTIDGTEEQRFVEEVEASEEESSISHDAGVHDALVYQYRPTTNDWIYWRTLAYIGKEKLEPEVKGGSRKLKRVKFLKQPDNKTWLAAKYYSTPMPVIQYLNDVIKQELARYFVLEFNRDLTLKQQSHPQVDTLPVWHLQILDHNGVVVNYWNIEQYIGQKYHKITDAFGGVSESSPNRDIMTALSHYSWQKSNWKVLIDDIQGWEDEKENSKVILTDPGIATTHDLIARNCGTGVAVGRTGFKEFWTGNPRRSHYWTHERNKYCKALDLQPPPTHMIEDRVVEAS